MTNCYKFYFVLLAVIFSLCMSSNVFARHTDHCVLVGEVVVDFRGVPSNEGRDKCLAKAEKERLEQQSESGGKALVYNSAS